jgi:hypothetical protein
MLAFLAFYTMKMIGVPLAQICGPFAYAVYASCSAFSMGL